MAATMQVPAQTLMVGDKIVPASLAEHRIDVVERAGGVTRVEAMGQSIVFADDEKVLIALVDGQLPPRQLAARVLGAAVHPFAVNRLYELWPQAHVMVHHYPEAGQTVVRIYDRRPADTLGENVGIQDVAREAACSDEDQFSRKMGIRLAFGRALKAVPR